MSVVDAAALLDPHAAAVLALLRAKDPCTDVVLHYVCSEVDVRIGLSAMPDLEIELLCPGNGPPTECWHAVRIEGDLRKVWRGPAIGCCPTQVLAFVDDLLHLPPEVLAGRYQLLG